MERGRRVEEIKEGWKKRGEGRKRGRMMERTMGETEGGKKVEERDGKGEREKEEELIEKKIRE